MQGVKFLRTFVLLVSLVEISLSQESCICPMNYAPECGIDGQAYSNSCYRRCAGGPCSGNGIFPVDSLNRVFAFTGNIFRRVMAPLNAMFGLPQGPGGCMCPAVYDPVCGVNGVTYGNSCESGCARVPVLHRGRCYTWWNSLFPFFG